MTHDVTPTHTDIIVLLLELGAAGALAATGWALVMHRLRRRWPKPSPSPAQTTRRSPRQ